MFWSFNLIVVKDTVTLATFTYIGVQGTPENVKIINRFYIKVSIDFT